MNIESTLLKRSHSTCELCSAVSHSKLTVYSVPPVKAMSVENSLIVCEDCRGQIEGHTSINLNHWRCLNDCMWSEYPAIQVMAWRMLSKLSDQDWARDLLDQLFLEEKVLNWAKSMNSSESESESENAKPTKDSNGTILIEGDSVTLIKDLEVKGANFTAKRGTLVKNISLTSNPEHIEGRVNGTHIVLLTCFLKKVI